jgi:LuxR family transcriptional regulator, maltose regulon positive regulatory protein
LEEARKVQQLGVVLAERIGSAQPKVALYICLGQTLLAQGDLPAAKEAMLRSDESVVHFTMTPAFRARHAAYRVMFAIRLNDRPGVDEWGQKLLEYSKNLSIDFQQVVPRFLIFKGDTLTAAIQLSDLYEKVCKMGAQGLGIQIRVYQALCTVNEQEALSYLGEALKVGEAGEYIRTFADEKTLLPLLRKAAAAGIVPEYTARLIKIMETENNQPGLVGNGRQIPPGLLSERELEVLLLLEKGFSNRQIAEKLVISLNTSKRHVHNIFEKLQAKTRVQVIARAREHKLL